MLGLGPLTWDSRVRGEIAWVVAHKAAEFTFALAGLKVFTTLMSPNAFGEYQLSLTTLVLLGYLFEVPISQVYLRRYHTTAAEGMARSAFLQTMRWLGVTTLIVAAVSAALTGFLAAPLGIGTFAVLAVGLAFLANAWRSVRVQVLDISRRRRRCMFENLGFYGGQIVAGAVALLVFGPSATVALLAFATLAAVFSGVGLRSFAREVGSLPKGPPAPLARLICTYGVPLALLTTCVWVQTSAERYVLGVQLDFDTVGRYVAAYQVCGFPFLAMSSIFTALVQPIAFQRALDVSDPAQLWSAHRLLLGTLGVYCAAGVPIIAAYALFGPLLMRLLARDAYVIPASVLTILAAARLLAFLGQLQHMFFKVHQQTRFLLLYSAMGALAAAGAAWLLVGAYGIFGAALAALITALLYNLALALAPGGTWFLLRGVRRMLGPARLTSWSVTPCESGEMDPAHGDVRYKPSLSTGRYKHSDGETSTWNSD